MTDDFESRLRASLHRHAQDAPDGDRVARRVLHAAARARVPGRRVRNARWRTWALPLAAAGAVAAIAATLVGVSQTHHSAAPPAGTGLPPSSAAPTGSVSVPSSPAPSTPAVTAPAAVPTDLHHVRVLDATFVGPDDGWLLASSDCIGKSGTCTAMLRTTDGGAHWTSMPNPPVNVLGVSDCAAPCAEHLRFANARTGYVYGDDDVDNVPAFYMTTDGGAHWTPQQGVNVVALETFDNNVIRVTTTDPGCGPPGCSYQVQTAAIGATAWSSPYPLSAGGMTTGAQLVRGGDHNAYVLVTGHPAGGSGTAFSTLFRSSDDGRSWTSGSVNAGEPCPQVGGEVDASLIAAGGGDRVAVMCTDRQAPNRSFIAVSSDGGANFAQTPQAPWLGARFLAGDPDTVLLVAGGSHVYRSIDGGANWQRVPGFTGTVSWAGFESNTVGRVVGAGGHTIWTTRDAGEHWTPLAFG